MVRARWPAAIPSRSGRTAKYRGDLVLTDRRLIFDPHSINDAMSQKKEPYVRDAIKAYTWGSAYASYEEKLKGTIATGKLADLTVLSVNILECAPREILEAKADYTIVGGKIVFAR